MPHVGQRVIVRRTHLVDSPCAVVCDQPQDTRRMQAMKKTEVEVKRLEPLTGKQQKAVVGGPRGSVPGSAHSCGT